MLAANNGKIKLKIPLRIAQKRKVLGNKSSNICPRFLH